MSKISDNQSDGSYQNDQVVAPKKKNQIDKFRHTKQVVVGTNDFKLEPTGKMQSFHSDLEENYGHGGNNQYPPALPPIFMPLKKQAKPAKGSSQVNPSGLANMMQLTGS